MKDQNNQLHQFENRKFQLERLSLFSDAVIAIAITLLIIELKLPKFEGGTAHDFLEALLHTQNHFLGFLCSFFLIAFYWTVHHKIFEYVKEIDDKLVWLNIMFLLSIVIMPFSTSVAFEDMTNPDYPWIFYSLNQIFVGICLYRFWHYLEKNPSKTVGLENKRFLKYKKMRSLSPIVAFSISIVLCFLNPLLARLSFLLILVGIVLLKKRYKDVAKIEN